MSRHEQLSVGELTLADRIKNTSSVDDSLAPTAYSAHVGGVVTVTSNAATDLDTTAAALEALTDEVAAISTQLNALISSLRSGNVIPS